MSAVAQAPVYAIHDGDVVRDRDTVLAIWHGNLGESERMRAKYDWFYLGASGDPPLLRLLRHEPDGSWAGACAAGRRRMLMHGREIQGGVMVDLAVTPAHRTLGPAMMLQQCIVEAGRRELDVLYGFPNPRAAAVFKRIGYRHWGDIVRYARVLRYSTYVRRRLPTPLAPVAGWLLDTGTRTRDLLRRLMQPTTKAAWSDVADERIDALWGTSAPKEGLTAIRDARHARWRFDRSPVARTRYLLVTRPGDDTLLAWFATQVEGDALFVRDFWSDDADRGVGMHYIDALVRAARREGHASVSVEIAARASRIANWESAGFVARGQRPVFGLCSDEAVSVRAEDLYLTSADEDE
jgi:GNAT superfamily N-acetyltransferase